MNSYSPFNRKFWRVGALTVFGLLLSHAVPAQPMPYEEVNPTVEIDDTFQSQARVVLMLLTLIVFMTLLIVGMMASKNPNKFSIMWFLNSITGKGSPDPEMDHEYDGITELDNPMPAYLRLIFYGSIIFAVVYLFHYHVLGTGVLQTEEYLAEMEEAEKKYQGIELPEDQIILITDQARLEKARTIFNENCATCHGEEMGGISGPNLTDAYWLHGGEVTDLYTTITEGVPGKTMISWKKRISSTQRLELASYILSMQGTSPPNPKAPEGTKMGEEAPAPEPDKAAMDNTVVDSATTP